MTAQPAPATDTATLIISALATDRPGLVEAIAVVVAKHGANWVDSAMSRLGGAFAGIVQVDVAPAALAALEADLLALSQHGITVTLHHPVPVAAEQPARIAAHLELLGQDNPGIVYRVTRTLAAAGVNVDELRTEVFFASMSGQPMFQLDAEVSLPDSLSVADLAVSLERLAEDLMVEIEVRPLPTA